MHNFKKNKQSVKGFWNKVSCGENLYLNWQWHYKNKAFENSIKYP